MSDCQKSSMCQLSVVDKLGNVVAEEVTPVKFAGFLKQHGKGSAVVVELHCGEEIRVDTVKLLRRFPRGAVYNARLLRRVLETPEGLNAAGHTVWQEV